MLSKEILISFSAFLVRFVNSINLLRFFLRVFASVLTPSKISDKINVERALLSAPPGCNSIDPIGSLPTIRSAPASSDIFSFWNIKSVFSFFVCNLITLYLDLKSPKDFSVSIIRLDSALTLSRYELAELSSLRALFRSSIISCVWEEMLS